MITLQARVTALQDLTRAYAEVSGKAIPDVIAKMAKKLSINLFQRLKALAPAKGSIRERMLAELHAGGGIKIRKSAYEFAAQKLGIKAEKQRYQNKLREMAGKKAHTGATGNLQRLAVMRELSIRESARGFTGVSALFKMPAAGANFNTQALARSGKALSLYTFDPRGAETVARFNWGTLSNALAKEAGESISQEQAQAAMTNALTDTVQDTLQYKRFSDDFRQQFIEAVNRK